MLRRTQFPPKEWLRDRLTEGLTYAEITDLWEKESGYRLSPGYVSVQVTRHFQDLPRRRPRHEYDLPWHIRTEHDDHTFAKRLRALARRRDGEVLKPTEEKTLENWLRDMNASDCVVDYVPDAVDRLDAFIPVLRQPGDREMTSIRHAEKDLLTPEELRLLEKDQKN